MRQPWVRFHRFQRASLAAVLLLLGAAAVPARAESILDDPLFQQDAKTGASFSL